MRSASQRGLTSGLSGKHWAIICYVCQVHTSEKQARLVQYEIWHNREALFPLGVPSPLAMFQPDIAARALGVEYEHREQLGKPLA